MTRKPKKPQRKKVRSRRGQIGDLHASVEDDLLLLTDQETGAESRWNRPRKRRISLRVDVEVVDWFKSKGPGYQTRNEPDLEKSDDGRQEADDGEVEGSGLHPILNLGCPILPALFAGGWAVIQMLKQITSQKLHAEHLPRLWQARYYDFPVWNEAKRIEKVRSIHRNPVKRGLAQRPENWKWSSVAHYATGVEGAVARCVPTCSEEEE